MSWAELTPTLVFLVLLLYAPGWCYLRLFRVPSLPALGAAPATTVATLGLGTVGFDLAGVPWNLATAVALLVLVGPALLGVRRLFSRSARPITCAVPTFAPRGGARRSATPGSVAVAVAVGVGVGTLILWRDLAQGIGSPGTTPQMHDSLFHLNGAELITQTGVASPLGGMSPLYGDGGGGFYPTAWHAVAALAATLSDVVAATNAMLVAGIVIPWLVGIAALAHVLVPHRPLVVAAAPVVGASALVFPTVAVVFKGLYPFGFAVALTPGVLALAALVVTGWRVHAVAGGLALLAGATGVLLAHPSGAAALAFLLAPLLLAVCWREGTVLRDAGRRWLSMLVGVAPWLLVGAVAVAVFTVPRLRAMANYPSPEGSRREALLYALLGSSPQETAGNLAIALLVLVGVGVAAALPRTRWIAASWAIALVLFVAASGPDNAMRTLTGFWYKSPDRLQSLFVTVSAVLGALGVVAVADGVRAVLPGGRTAGNAARADGRGSRRPADAITVAVAIGVLGAAYVSSGGFLREERVRTWTATAYDPAVMVHPAWASEEELDFVEGLSAVLPADATVIGDPMNGAAFVQVLAGRRAYIPILGDSALSADQDYLLEHFNDIAKEPAVCNILRRDGVGYYYADESFTYGPTTLAAMRPGLYNVDVTEGFELLAADGTAALYRITACG